MQKFKRIISLLMILIMAIGILSSCGKNDKDGSGRYTLRDYSEANPQTWNPHSWQTNGDSYIMNYTQPGFVDVRMKEDGVYEWVYEMATNIEDITSEATEQDKIKWNIQDGQTGRLWKITLNPDAKWEDGTPIKADDYIYSMQQLLSSEMKNSRADLYWSGESAVYNGEIWFRQGEDKYVTIGVKGYANGNSAINAGESVYLNMHAFWGLNGCTNASGKECPEFVKITDTVLYRDVNVTDENDPEAWVSAKYLYDNYLASGKGYEAYGATYLYVKDGKTETISWDEVGLYKTGDYEIVYVTNQPQQEYYFKVSCTSTWLVNKDLYEAGKKTEASGLVTTNYATSVDTYKSYGPYKLVSFEKDKQFILTKNENWYGYTDGNHEGEYQTTDIKCSILTDHDTILQMFLKGELDNINLTADDLAEYSASDYLLKTPESYTIKYFFNTNLDVLKALEAERKDGNNLQILSLTSFIKAISLSFDRVTWCKEVTAGEIPQIGLLSSLYVYDVANDPNSVYRDNEIAMKGIVNLYGIEYGEGKQYATLKEAYDSITGYDLEEAKKLFTESYNTAKANGLYKDGQKIVINIGASKGSVTDELTKQEKKFNDFLKAATEGTPLEGKVSVKYVYNLENRYGDVADGNRECGLGGLGGATFYPFRAFNSYIDPEQAVGGKIPEGNFDAKAVKVKITYDFDGDGVAEEIEDTLFNWNASIQAGGKYYTADNNTKLTILSKIETTLISAYQMFPVSVSTSVSMYSKKIQYATTNYNYMYGYGGTRQMTYLYDDAQWASYVAKQGNTLNYR